MNNTYIWTIVLILLVASGYTVAYFQYQKATNLQKKVIERELQDISVIDDTLFRLRDNKRINKRMLEESKTKINKILEEIERRDTSEIDLQDALKLINDL